MSRLEHHQCTRLHIGFQIVGLCNCGKWNAVQPDTEVGNSIMDRLTYEHVATAANTPEHSALLARAQRRHPPTEREWIDWMQDAVIAAASAPTPPDLQRVLSEGRRLSAELKELFDR